MASVITAVGFIPAVPVFAAGQLDAPAVEQNSGITGPGGSNPASRTINWEEVPGAVSYDLYVFNTLANASAGENAVARASIPADGDVEFNFRHITFEELGGSGVTYSAEVVNDPNFIRGMFMSGNLRPGAYWVRARAIAEDTANNSELSALAQTRQFGEYELEYLPLIIAMGPSEAREIIETRFDDIGTSLRLVDLRPNVPAPGIIFYEYWVEGYIRFVDERLVNIHAGSEARTTEVNWQFMTDEEVFAALPDRDATILLL
jgi:hypothetical protein